MILLERKARNILKGGEKSKKVSFLIPRESPVLTAKESTRDSIFLSSPLPKSEPQSPTFTLYGGSSPQAPGIPITRETSDRQVKRKAYGIFETPPQVPVSNGVQISSSNKSLISFCGIALLDKDGPLPKKRPSEPRSVSPTPAPAVHVIDVDVNDMHDEENAPNIPDRSTVREESQTISVDSSGDKEDSNINTNTNGNDQRAFHKPYAYKSSFPVKTTFLVSSSTQPSMGSVWVPFRDFNSASLLLSYMAAECHPEDWQSLDLGQSPSRQPNNEISRNGASSSSSQNIIAATVKLE